MKVNPPLVQHALEIKSGYLLMACLLIMSCESFQGKQAQFKRAGPLPREGKQGISPWACPDTGVSIQLSAQPKLEAILDSLLTKGTEAASRSPMLITWVGDLNGDDQPDFLVTGLGNYGADIKAFVHCVDHRYFLALETFADRIEVAEATCPRHEGWKDLVTSSTGFRSPIQEDQTFRFEKGKYSKKCTQSFYDPSNDEAEIPLFSDLKSRIWRNDGDTIKVDRYKYYCCP